MSQLTDTQIAQLIATLPIGRANAVNAPDLARQLGYSPTPNQEELRALIRQAIGQGVLIGSSRAGYWVINSKVEMEEVLESLHQRAQGVCDRRNYLLSSWNTNNPENPSSLTNVEVQ